MNAHNRPTKNGYKQREHAYRDIERSVREDSTKTISFETYRYLTTYGGMSGKEVNSMTKKEAEAKERELKAKYWKGLKTVKKGKKA